MAGAGRGTARAEAAGMPTKTQEDWHDKNREILERRRAGGFRRNHPQTQTMVTEHKADTDRPGFYAEVRQDHGDGI